MLWPGVQYRSGQAFDLARIAAAARSAGAVCGFDLAHAIGNLPLALHDDGADFRRVVQLQVPQRRPRRDRRRIRARAPCAHARCRGLAGWWGHEPATRFRDGARFRPCRRRRRLATQQSADSLGCAADRVAGAFRRGRHRAAAREVARAERVCCGASCARASAAQLQRITPEAPARQGCQLSLRVRAGRETGRRVFDTLNQLGIVATGASRTCCASRRCRSTTASATSPGWSTRSTARCTGREFTDRRWRAGRLPASPYCSRAAGTRSRSSNGVRDPLTHARRSRSLDQPGPCSTRHPRPARGRRTRRHLGPDRDDARPAAARA